MSEVIRRAVKLYDWLQSQNAHVKVVYPVKGKIKEVILLD